MGGKGWENGDLPVGEREREREEEEGDNDSE